MAIDPDFTPKTSTFKPTNWDIAKVGYRRIAVPVDNIGGTITASTINYNYDLPGQLLDYTMKYDLDWILASGMSGVDLHNYLKKELAGKLAEKMMEDGHFSFTKQVDHADNSVRYKAYTWVGNKDFIEQQRKNKQ
jgi:hypothetical protein